MEHLAWQLSPAHNRLGRCMGGKLTPQLCCPVAAVRALAPYDTTSTRWQHTYLASFSLKSIVHTWQRALLPVILVVFTSYRLSSLIRLYHSALLGVSNPFPQRMPFPNLQPAKQTGRQTQKKKPNTGRGPNPDGINVECLKTTTWQWALHRRFQRKSNISFQNGP